MSFIMTHWLHYWFYMPSHSAITFTYKGTYQAQHCLQQYQHTVGGITRGTCTCPLHCTISWCLHDVVDKNSRCSVHFPNTKNCSNNHHHVPPRHLHTQDGTMSDNSADYSTSPSFLLHLPIKEKSELPNTVKHSRHLCRMTTIPLTNNTYLLG